MSNPHGGLEKLAPCPFCSGKAIQSITRDGMVACQDCPAEMPRDFWNRRALLAAGTENATYVARCAVHCSGGAEYFMGETPILSCPRCAGPVEKISPAGTGPSDDLIAKTLARVEAEWNRTHGTEGPGLEVSIVSEAAQTLLNALSDYRRRPHPTADGNTEVANAEKELRSVLLHFALAAKESEG